MMGDDTVVVGQRLEPHREFRVHGRNRGSKQVWLFAVAVRCSQEK